MLWSKKNFEGEVSICMIWEPPYFMYLSSNIWTGSYFFFNQEQKEILFLWAHRCIGLLSSFLLGKVKLIFLQQIKSSEWATSLSKERFYRLECQAYRVEKGFANHAAMIILSVKFTSLHLNNSLNMSPCPLYILLKETLESPTVANSHASLGL